MTPTNQPSSCRAPSPRSGGELFALEDIDFGRRMAVEREIARAEGLAPPNAVFDDSGHFLLYPSLLGVKVLNMTTNKVRAAAFTYKNYNFRLCQQHCCHML